MRFEGSQVLLTPAEAAFIEDAWAYNDENTLPDKVRLKIKAETLDYASKKLPEGFNAIQGIARYSAFRFYAGQDWNPEDGETISVDLDAEELAKVKELATLVVLQAKEDAGMVGIDFEITSLISDLSFPESAPDMVLSKNDEEALKAQIFEEKLATIATGDGVIAAITDRGI